MKIRYKLFLFMLIFMTTVLSILYFINLRISRNLIIADFNAHVNTAVKFKAQNIETLLLNYAEISNLLARCISGTFYNETGIDRETRMKNLQIKIDNTIQTHETINRIRIVDIDGIVIASSNEDLRMDISDKAIFREGMKGFFISELHFSEFTRNYVINISIPIEGEDEISGVLVINFDPEKELFPIVKDLTGLLNSTDIYLLSKDYQLLSPTKNGDLLIETKISSEQIRLCHDDHIDCLIPTMDLKKQLQYTNYRDKKVMGTHYYISMMKWFLIVEVDEEDVMRPVKKYRNFLLVLFSTILLLALAISYIISIFLTKPIKKLEAGIQEIIAGNLDHKVATKSKDEIGHLSRIFDDMTSRLNNSTKELETHAGKLEEKVKERTAELNKQFEKSEQQRIATLCVLSDLNDTSINLKSEIIEHQKDEEQIKTDLKIKTALLQELYHRTKNNMQLIASMLKMQSRSIENRSLAGISSIDFLHDSFDAIINRIKAMSMVHQKLYQAEDLSYINLKEYINDLLNLLMISYHIRSETISLKLEMEDVFVLIDSAIPMSLVLNELISNVFKHAFPDNAKGELSIRLFKDKIDSINIQLSDNGIGIPVDIDLENVNTIGIQTVFSLIKHQLNGQIRYDTEKGLKWHFKFKDDQHKERV